MNFNNTMMDKINWNILLCGFGLTLLFMVAHCGNKPIDPNLFSWEEQRVGDSPSLRGICVYNEHTIWASGSHGFCAKTINGGETWEMLDIPGSDSLDFRDIHVFDRRIVYLLSAGSGNASRIYKTEDAGKTWRLQYQNSYPGGFFSAMAFWDKNQGLAFSDPVGGKFIIIRTNNGGKNWEEIDHENIPPAKEGEYAFAASGTCLITEGDQNAWFGTGGSDARVFYSVDRGETWQVAETPISSGTASSGIFSLAFKDNQNGVAVGGDYQKPDQAKANVIKTTDGGKTWHLVPDSDKLEYRSCVVYLPGFSNGLISVGRSGSDYSIDGGETWQMLSETGYYTVDFAKTGLVGWAAGSNGRVAKFIYKEAEL